MTAAELRALAGRLASCPVDLTADECDRAAGAIRALLDRAERAERLLRGIAALAREEGR